MMKRIAVLLLGLMILITNVPIYASEFENKATLEELQNNEALQEEIDSYFNSKLTQTRTSQVDNLSTVQKNAVARANGFYEFKERAEVEFTDVEIISSVEEIISQNDEEIRLKVREWTEIEYLASPDSKITDVMGYGTDHEMTFEISGTEYVLVEDSFDERLITGVCSDDVLLKVEDEEVEFIDEGMNTSSINSTRVYYDVAAVINYAHTYCGVVKKNYNAVGGVNTGTYHTSLYNQNYPIYGGRDCANFVSQCIAAGGIPTNSTWSSGTSAWINARGLAEYLVSKGYTSCRATNSTVYPGNPVYWLNAVGADPSGHQMICTGYNSNNVPVVDAHNSDLFRVPITAFNYTLYTIQIATSDRHTHAASDQYTSITASYHTVICLHCRDGYKQEAHTVVTSGNSKYCSKCGYTGPFTNIASVMPAGEEEIKTDSHD